MAYAIMGGLAVATLLTLVFLPGPLRDLVPDHAATAGAQPHHGSAATRYRDGSVVGMTQQWTPPISRPWLR